MNTRINYINSIYHYNNVLNLYDMVKQEIIKLETGTRKLSNGRPFYGGLKMFHNADEFTYELSAFLASIKTCLDFLATAVRTHLTGFDNMDSIKTLMNQVEKKGMDEGIFEVIKKHLDWLKKIRDYRHKVIHRTVILTKSSVESPRFGFSCFHFTKLFSGEDGCWINLYSV